MMTPHVQTRTVKTRVAIAARRGGYPLVLLAALLACGMRPAWAADASAQIAQGQRVYQKWCVACHGPGPGFMGRPLTGTEALEAKYDGKLPPVLDQRTDLNPAMVRYFVRHGISLMPFFRRTEISDDELAALGAYLSRNNPALAH